METNVKTLTVTCCIAGGGPAGMMLGFLLARAGIDVLVLEKHADFLRDFRGDTVHPSTLEVMHELGILNDFLSLPHQKIQHLSGQFINQEVVIADFSHLSVHAPYIAMMPQWDFLNFLAKQASAYPNFKLMMQAQVTDIIEKDNVIVGAKVLTPEGHLQIYSELLVGADGRTSIVRNSAKLLIEEYGVPMDVFWFKLSRQNTDTTESFGRILPGKMMVTINRQDYWQCGYVIPKGESENIKQKGLNAFCENIAETLPFLGNRVNELKDWDQIKLLTVKVDRLKKWYRPGLICIGDAAHAMSPIGGVGINLAIQDAVAAANLLSKPLLAHKINESDLLAVQKRRYWPVVMTQRLQLLLQKKLIFKILKKELSDSLPLPFRLSQQWPYFRRITGYLIGMGFRPEHVKKEKQ